MGLHVCLVCHEYPPAPHGGTGSSYRDLCEALVSHGHKATVVGIYPNLRETGQKQAEEITNGVRVIRFCPSPSWLRYHVQALTDRFRISRWLQREHRENPIQIVEASDYGGWLRFGAPPRVPTVIRIRGSNHFFDTELKRPPQTFEHKLERAALAKADYLAGVSVYAARRSLELAGLGRRDCQIIYNAVDTKVFSPSTRIPVDPGLIVYANSINPKKGIEELLDAMNQIFPKFHKAKLVIIGQDTQKPLNGIPYLDRLKKRIHPSYQDRVLFTGRLDRLTGVLDYLRRAHICCYPSHLETFGIAAIEAMSVGRPTIFSKTGPGQEIVEHGVSGLLCDPHDPDSIAQNISMLLENVALAEQLGQNARKRVLAHFDKEKWIRTNIDFYKKCLIDYTDDEQLA